MRSVAAGLAVLGALGCSVLTPPLTPPERGGAAWTELTSAHFILDTDLEPQEAEAALLEFEGTFTSIEDVAFTTDREPRTLIRVVLFNREGDFRRFDEPPRPTPPAGRGAGGGQPGGTSCLRGPTPFAGKASQPP